MIPEIPGTTERIFCYFKPFFALLPPNNPKSQNFEKIKKSPGDIITLHMCTINDNYMMYGSGDMECDGRNFCHFGPFLPFYPTDNPKNQNFDKLKEMPGGIIILHKCTKNHDYTVV